MAVLSPVSIERQLIIEDFPMFGKPTVPTVKLGYYWEYSFKIWSSCTLEMTFGEPIKPSTVNSMSSSSYFSSTSGIGIS